MGWVWWGADGGSPHRHPGLDPGSIQPQRILVRHSGEWILTFVRMKVVVSRTTASGLSRGDSGHKRVTENA